MRLIGRACTTIACPLRLKEAQHTSMTPEPERMYENVQVQSTREAFFLSLSFFFCRPEMGQGLGSCWALGPVRG